MMENTTVNFFAIAEYLHAFRILNLFPYIVSICLNVIWLIICMKLCYRMALSYRASKRTPLLHPIHRDVQYLSLQRKLYNLKTHFIKYILICMCLCVEILQVVSIFVYTVLNTKHITKYTFDRIGSKNSTCNISSYFANVYRSPLLIPVQNSPFINFLLLSPYYQYSLAIWHLDTSIIVSREL